MKVVPLFPRPGSAASQPDRSDSNSASERRPTPDPNAGVEPDRPPATPRLKRKRAKLTPAAVIAQSIGPRADPLQLMVRALGGRHGRPPEARPSADQQFWHVWMAHRDYLQRFSLRFSNGNAADAEDALSDAMLKAAAAFETTVVRNERAWLLRLVYNACMDRHRGHRRQHRIVEEIGRDDCGLFPIVTPQRGRSPEELLSAIQLVSGLKQALEALPRSLAEPLLLYLEEWPDAAIAARLNVTPVVVRKRRQMARAWLRRHLAE